MKLWRSVVGKLWMTILLLVSFVLFILTILLLEFFGNYHVIQIEQDLSETANKVASIIKAHSHDNLGEEIAFEIASEPAEVVIAYNKDQFEYSPHADKKKILSSKFFLKDKQLRQVFSEGKTVMKEIGPMEGETEGSRYNRIVIAGVPMSVDGQQGAVFIYQSLEVLKETTEQTTKLIVLAAGIAIILTTFFAFFLSTRITAPLRKMKEAVFEVAKGKFDTKVPSLSHDEIGELAIAFNQMGKQLKFNMNALSHEKEQLASILSSMADGVMTFSRDGTILLTNPPAEWFLQPFHVGQACPVDGIPSELSKLLKKVMESENEQTGELAVQGRSYVVIVSPLYNQETIRGAVAVIRDMTEERRLDKLRIDFVANVSHELRTPIAMLQGYSEAIVDDIAASEAEKKEIAKIIYDESLRIGRLVNELLDLARMEAGHTSLNIEQLDVGLFIQRVVNKFQGLARDNGISLEMEPIRESETLSFDADRIEQVLTNLIDNAIRHTDKNGTVRVSARFGSEGMLVDVSDNGSGIPEEDLPFVFERFYKADKARTRGRSGTGLGLSIAKNIIDAHSGHIAVQSRVGEGTTFSFFLPRI